ncbi:MAG TPA: Xaa-Pro aminopeptidase [Gammaproteobacteria bacterium]|nr:Xaa-Pro aminopeptidase [Gammaproteobacteria bacterium]|tara:strand:- start:54 stop:1325 length:1272 start_codon:yes stop_codon:yes gene_type:complete
MALMEPNSIAILPASEIQIRNNGVEHRYRQDSDFHYLIGFDEPDSVFVLIPGREYGEAILFCREREHDHERWHGTVTGPERAAELYGVDDAFPIDDIDDILPGLIEGRFRLYYAMGTHLKFDTRILSWVNSIGMDDREGTEPPGELIQLGQYLHELRLHKSAKEIDILRHAAQISAAAHIRVMETLAPGMMEYEVEAELEYQFSKRGARHPAYPSIVGGGSNACTLHYIDNDKVLNAGDLVLIDAGGEYEYYASDVTRTLPVSGKFSDEQAALYEVVLAAQRAAIEQVVPGNHWNQPHEAAVTELTTGLKGLGLLEGNVEELLEVGAYNQFYMHRTGHWLGLDVHDVGEYKVGGEWRVFEKGMVTTVEPGLYIPEHAENVPEAYRGIGIRIEDNVAVTRDGHDVLTDDIPKTIAEVEQTMSAI